MRKRSSRRIYPFLVSVLLAVLFTFSSCGIPTIANFDDVIEISNISSTTNEFTISLDSTLGYTLRDNSPGLLLMYCITDSADTSPVNTLTFDSTYGQISSGRQVNFNSDYSSESGNLKVEGAILNRTRGTESSETGIYHTALFPFIPEQLDDYSSISPNNGYTLNLNSLLGNNGGSITLKIEFDVESRLFYMTINNGESIPLKRYKGSEFISYSEATSNNNLDNENSNSSYGDYWYFKKLNNNGSNGLQINIYAAINIMGQDFSNIYWSNLENIGYITIE